MPRTKKAVAIEEVETPIVSIPVSEIAQPSNVCPNCNGTGRQNADDLCVICQGRGTVL